MPITKKYVDVQEQDFDTFAAIYHMQGYATVPQIATLFPSDKVVRGYSRGGIEGKEKRLLKLATYDYLKIVEAAEERTYTLNRVAAEALALQRGYNLNKLKTQIRKVSKYLSGSSHKVSHLKHRQGINDFRIALTAALRHHPKADWVYDDNGQPYWNEPATKEEEQWFTVTIKRQHIPAVTELKVRGANYTSYKLPDASFIIRPNKDYIEPTTKRVYTIAYLYEKDRTQGEAANAKKMLNYLHWHKQKRHYPLFATKHLRVLFETESEAKLKNLIEDVALKLTLNGSALFWFTTKENINLDNPAQILEPIWVLGHANHYARGKPFSEQQKHSLLEYSPPEASE